MRAEIDYALDILDRLSSPPSDADVEDLFWSLQNILDMPYGPEDG